MSPRWPFHPRGHRQIRRTGSGANPGRRRPFPTYSSAVRKPLVIPVACLMVLAGCAETPDAFGPLSEANSPSANPPTGKHACSSRTPSANLPSRYDGTLTLQPSRAKAGDKFRARFPNRRARTDILLMNSTASLSCVRSFLLQADGTGPRWRELHGEEGVMTLGAVQPRANIPAVVPDIAEPGEYRVCDEDSRACALLEVVR